MNTSVNNNNETKNAANMVASDNMKVADYLANLKKQKGESFGDLCWDNYGKASVIVFGNIAGHADELEILGGKRIEAKYSALQNGRKWSERWGRTTAYLFGANAKEAARRYLTEINHAIMNAALRKEGETLRPAQAYKVGERVTTIHGTGTVTEHEARYGNGRCRCVRLDRPTYNYGWEGMPQTFIEVSEENMKPNDEKRTEALHQGQDITAFAEEYCKPDIVDAAEMGVSQCLEHEGKRIEIRTAYKNGHNDPEGWTYCVSWYEGKELVECENGVSLTIAAEHMARFEKGAAKGLTLRQILYGLPEPPAEITLESEPEIKAAHMEQERTFGQAFDAAYYRDVLASLTGKKKVFHFGIPADTVRLEVKRECEGYWRISMKRGDASEVERFAESIDWETILNTTRAAEYLSQLRADHTKAHPYKLGDLVRVNDEQWGQVNGHAGRITRIVLKNSLVGSYYTVEFTGDLPRYNDGQPMKENNFEPLDIEPAA